MSVANSQKHFANIERKITKSNNIVAKGKDMKLGDVMKLGSKSNSINSEIKKAIQEYDGSDPTPEEIKSILMATQRVVELTEKHLELLVANKERFAELHVGGLVKKNVSKTQATGAELSKLLLSKAPAELKSHSDALETRRAKAFATASAAFENAKGGEDKADELKDDSE